MIKISINSTFQNTSTSLSFEVKLWQSLETTLQVKLMELYNKYEEK